MHLRIARESLLSFSGTHSRRPREALPEPAGCNGGSYQATTSAAAAAECAASGCQTCQTPFANGGFYYAICLCNVSTSVNMMRNGQMLTESSVKVGCEEHEHSAMVRGRDIGESLGSSVVGDDGEEEMKRQDSSAAQCIST